MIAQLQELIYTSVSDFSDKLIRLLSWYQRTILMIYRAQDVHGDP